MMEDQMSGSDRVLKELESTGILKSIEEGLRKLFGSEQFLDILVRNKVDFEVILQFSNSELDKEQVLSLANDSSSSTGADAGDIPKFAFAASGPGWGVSTSTVCRVKGGTRQC